MAKREPLLNDFEQLDPSAEKIINYLKGRLVKLRLDNDSYDSDRTTRGRIAEIKDFLKTLEPEKVIKTSKHVRSM